MPDKPIPSQNTKLQENKVSEDQAQPESVNASAGIVSVCVLISRITGFVRTWVMAFALGSTALASSYQVANNLPNMLYELVMAGILTTAFLPVYISVKRRLGNDAGNEYASNLITLVTILLGIVSLLGILFPQVIIYTQSFYSDQEQMSTATFLFQFFAIQTVFYGISSIFSGLLNANRDYFWSSFAPVANNLIVIASFLLYVAIAQNHPTMALYAIAIGNPLGVAVQMLIQMPFLKHNGIRLRPRINLRDPALRETFVLGGAAMLVMACSFVTVSVMNAASYSFAENGPSVIAYARLWYTLPYSLMAVPLTTAFFTELTYFLEDKNESGFIKAVSSGTSQIVFLLIPFSLYLMVFSEPLITLYRSGAFTMENVAQIASFLSALALALPFYGVSAYLQKIFSSLRRMGVYAGVSIVASVVQVAFTMLATYAYQQGAPIPMESIAWGSVLFCAVSDVLAFVYLKWRFGHIGFVVVLKAAVRGLALGALGALAGYLVLNVLFMVFGTLNGSILQALVYVVLGGIASLVTTFGLAIKLRLTEGSFVTDKVVKILGSKFNGMRNGVHDD